MIRLVVLDCDGTLVDSQYVIFEAMRRALVEHGRDPLPIDRVRRVVGLSLVEAMALLHPEDPAELWTTLAASYRSHFHRLREEGVAEPLYPEVRATLEALARGGVLLAMATGKSRRGLDQVLAHHRLDHLFASLQTADDNPSKPHPAMLERALAETGSRREEAVFVGDTTFDMAMARATAVRGLGVAHGYHAPGELLAAGAERVIGRFGELLDLCGAPR